MPPANAGTVRELINTAGDALPPANAAEGISGRIPTMAPTDMVATTPTFATAVAYEVISRNNSFIGLYFP